MNRTKKYNKIHFQQIGRQPHVSHGLMDSGCHPHPVRAIHRAKRLEIDTLPGSSKWLGGLNTVIDEMLEEKTRVMGGWGEGGADPAGGGGVGGDTYDDVLPRLEGADVVGVVHVVHLLEDGRHAGEIVALRQRRRSHMTAFGKAAVVTNTRTYTHRHTHCSLSYDTVRLND